MSRAAFIWVRSYVWIIIFSASGWSKTKKGQTVPMLMCEFWSAFLSFCQRIQRKRLAAAKRSSIMCVYTT